MSEIERSFCFPWLISRLLVSHFSLPLRPEFFHAPRQSNYYCLIYVIPLTPYEDQQVVLSVPQYHPVHWTEQDC